MLRALDEVKCDCLRIAMGGDSPLVVEWVCESEYEESMYVWIHLACDGVRLPVRRICDSTWCKESDLLNANVYHVCHPLIALCLATSLLVLHLCRDILMAVHPEWNFFSPVYAVFFSCIVMIQCLLGLGFEVQKEMIRDLSRVE
jgi:hypothetical protein